MTEDAGVVHSELVKKRVELNKLIVSAAEAVEEVRIFAERNNLTAMVYGTEVSYSDTYILDTSSAWDTSWETSNC